jgi:hypothetical protein
VAELRAGGGLSTREACSKCHLPTNSHVFYGAKGLRYFMHSGIFGWQRKGWEASLVEAHNALHHSAKWFSGKNELGYVVGVFLALLPATVSRESSDFRSSIPVSTLPR